MPVLHSAQQHTERMPGNVSHEPVKAASDPLSIKLIQRQSGALKGLFAEPYLIPNLVLPVGLIPPPFHLSTSCISHLHLREACYDLAEGRHALDLLDIAQTAKTTHAVPCPSNAWGANATIQGKCM